MCDQKPIEYNLNVTVGNVNVDVCPVKSSCRKTVSLHTRQFFKRKNLLFLIHFGSIYPSRPEILINVEQSQNRIFHIESVTAGDWPFWKMLVLLLKAFHQVTLSIQNQ